jgi:predicted aspartyl protease
LDFISSDYVTVNPRRAARLGIVWRRRGRAPFADGSESVFDIYEAVVDWDGNARRIPVDEAETVPLVGMSLLEGYELTV